MTYASSWHAYGYLKEDELKGDIETIVGEKLEKTAKGARHDFENPETVVELKSRPALSGNGVSQKREYFDTWLIPCCKTDCLRGKKLIFFYYWGWDKTLWRCDYDPELWATFERGVPFWKESQEHFYVPAEHWTLVKSY